ncbi:RraA family protein [Microbacterium sp.]|uniref:RraA family protein n=1 Tax=Microbacterium sp. TaxID=51671 RepID=UPI003A8AC221
MSAVSEDADELLRFGSATVYEASRADVYLDPVFRPAWHGAQAVGTALPVQAQAGDNLALHHAIAAAGPGDILVVDAGGAPFGYWGEVMAVAAQSRGIAGLVIDGGVRDTDAMAHRGFPAFSTCVSIRGTEKHWAGTIGIPITMRGRVVCRGDVIVADGDGIAVVPFARYPEVLVAARERASREESIMGRLRAGESTLDVYGFRPLGEPIRLNERTNL